VGQLLGLLSASSFSVLFFLVDYASIRPDSTALHLLLKVFGSHGLEINLQLKK